MFVVREVEAATVAAPARVLDVAIELRRDVARVLPVSVHHIEMGDLIALHAVVEAEVRDALAVRRNHR